MHAVQRAINKLNVVIIMTPLPHATKLSHLFKISPQAIKKKFASYQRKRTQALLLEEQPHQLVLENASTIDEIWCCLHALQIDSDSKCNVIDVYKYINKLVADKTNTRKPSKRRKDRVSKSDYSNAARRRIKRQTLNKQ
jgi:hypothetical protein